MYSRSFVYSGSSLTFTEPMEVYIAKDELRNKQRVGRLWLSVDEGAQWQWQWQFAA
jgi:hypothetical protein